MAKLSPKLELELARAWAEPANECMIVLFVFVLLSGHRIVVLYILPIFVQINQLIFFFLLYLICDKSLKSYFIDLNAIFR